MIVSIKESLQNSKILEVSGNKAVKEVKQRQKLPLTKLEAVKINGNKRAATLSQPIYLPCVIKLR